MSNKRTHRLYSPEFKRIAGNKRRRYVNNETGEVISRYKYSKIAERIPVEPSVKRHIGGESTQRGTKGVGALGRGKRNAVYQDLLTRYTNRANDYNKAIGEPAISRNDARQTPEFKIMYRAYKNSADRTKNGLRHNALIYFGILTEDDDYY